MGKLKNMLALADKIMKSAKSEIEEERSKNLVAQAKNLLEELNTAKRTVALLEKQVQNFKRAIENDDI